MKTPIWEYNNKYYLKTNDVKVKEAQVENGFKKDVPYIMDLSFTKYNFDKNKEQITGFSISEINRNEINTITKHVSCLSHCKVSCDSPCCVKLCGDEDNHCNCNIDIHETIDSDEEEQIEKQ